MKNIFLISVSCFILYAIGCQENSLIEPLTSEVTKKDGYQEDTYLHGFIKLDGMLADPSRPFNCYLQISGEIEYEHKLIYIGPIQPASQYYVSLKLAIEAELINPYSQTDHTWTISEISKDRIDVQIGQVQSLIKYFRVQDRDDVMYLVCKFIVATDDVILDRMWLKVPRLHSSNNVAQ